MMRGYFILGSTASDPPKLSFLGFDGNHVGSKNRGYFVSESDFACQTLNIPSRDKQVLIWYSMERLIFSDLIEKIDSEPGPNYRAKLLAILEILDPAFQGVINNASTSTHGSLALLNPEGCYGLHDNYSSTSYFMWGSENDLRSILIANPLRYLVYRFPTMPIVFLPGEIICSKWWKWSKLNLLHAFNALEMRLNNGPAG